MYSPSWLTNAPFLVDAEDRNDPNILTIYGEDTEVYTSCSVTFRNRFYVFGGLSQKRQISEVTQCKLKRIGTLDFDHQFWDCTNVGDKEIYLCFGINCFDQCRSADDPLGSYRKEYKVK